MTPPLQRSTVPSTSPISGRQPLTPEVENIAIGGGGGGGTGKEPPAQPEPAREPQTPVVTDSGSPEGPKWQGMQRKEARLRADQVHDLAALRRHVAGQRRDRSEIITDNTLIRIAVDLLMTQAHRLRGDTEEELLRSVSPRSRRTQVREAGSTEVRD
jgi:hypothetical protein